MAKSVKLKAFAKVNLSLDITGKSGAMHTLDSVMMSVDIFDTVYVTERDDGRITVKFIGADVGEDNTAYRAAQAVMRAIGGNGWDITVEKRIPIGAGLGGSSADACAVLRALDVMYKLPELGVDMRSLALSIGSDVPFMLTGGLARVRGTGDDLFFMENKLGLFCVGLFAPSNSVSTRSCYALYDKMCGEVFTPSGNDELCALILDGNSECVNKFDNALMAPALSLCPDIKQNADLLRSLGAKVNLTGSGGMVVGYFTDISAFIACADVLKTRPDFYCFAPAPAGVIHEWVSRE